MKKLMMIVAASLFVAGCGNGAKESLGGSAVASETETSIVTESGLVLKEGVHYREVEPIDRDMDDLTVLFWYGCPHCQDLRLPLEKFEEKYNVEADERHALLSQGWVLDALFFYTAQTHMRFNGLHNAYFDARERSRMPLDGAEIAKVVESKGMTPEQFLRHDKKDRVEFQIERTRDIERHYKIDGVPSLIVGGKYVVLNQGFGSKQEMMEGTAALLKHVGHEPEKGPRAKDGAIDALERPATPISEQ